jgi:hypothetical protein
MIPPNRLSARLRCASVTILDGVGPVVAATNETTGAARAAVAGCIGPSELGAARGVGVVSRVETRAKFIAATVDDVALPETRISRTSVVWVPEAPFRAMNVDVEPAVAEPAAEHIGNDAK